MGKKNKMDSKIEVLENNDEKLDEKGEKEGVNIENKNDENINASVNNELSSENFKLEVRNLPKSFGFGV